LIWECLNCALYFYGLLEEKLDSLEIERGGSGEKQLCCLDKAAPECDWAAEKWQKQRKPK
jgi:hypothetical protein